MTFQSKEQSKMRKLFQLLFRLTLILLVILAGIFIVNTVGFSSKQIPIETIDAIAVEPAAFERLSKAIQLPTVSSQNNLDTGVFQLLDTLIEKEFPLIDSFLQFTSINHFSKLYKWSGKNPGLKPILLIAHTDVVPVEVTSQDKWTEAPYSGVIKDGFIWGRGSLDDKNSVFGILEAVEMLLREGYTPERSVYLAFGHDEEISGKNGAEAMAKYLKQKDVQFDFVLDEGQFIIQDAMTSLSKPLAMIGIAEKGYVTLNLDVQLEKGGHSSMPPKETAIGILSAAITRLQNHPFPGRLDGATGQLLSYAGPEMDLPYRVLFANTWFTGGLVKHVFGSDEGTSALIRTTTAPTLLKSGIKDNVLPTTANASINFRIIPGETVESVKAYVEKTIDDARISIAINEYSATNPSPISGTNTFGYQVIQKSVQEIFPNVIVAPSLVVAATDSRYFYELSENIYRFMPVSIDRSELEGFHGINERISLENYQQMIRFYRQLILNSCK